MTLTEQYATALECLEQMSRLTRGSAPAVELRAKREALAKPVLAFVSANARSKVMRDRQDSLLKILSSHV